MEQTTLIKKLAKQTGLSVSQATQAVEMTFELIKQSLATGDTITIQAFGRFGVEYRPAKRLNNPATGEEVVVVEARLPTFKASVSLKKWMNRPAKQSRRSIKIRQRLDGVLK